MQIFLWIVAQVAGALGTIFEIANADLNRGAGITLGRETLIYYADSLLWVGVSLTLFPILHFLERTAKPDEMMLYAGRPNSVILFLCVILLMVFTIAFGQVSMADAKLIASLSVIDHETFAYFLVGAFFLSLSYIVRSQARVWYREWLRRSRRANK